MSAFRVTEDRPGPVSSVAASSPELWGAISSRSAD